MAKSLASYGLNYEDCMIEKNEVQEALYLAPNDVMVGRNRRIKRAMDLSFKKKNLATYAPELAKAAEDQAYQFQISETVQKIRDRDEERELLHKGW